MKWIDIFAQKLKNEEHYGLPLEKDILTEKLGKLIDQYKTKANNKAGFSDLPINKKIIGKNYQTLLKDSFVCDKYKMQQWAHETYVLPNRPFGSGNLSLPDDEFSFASTAEPVKAKYFLKSVDIPLDKEDQIVEKQFTVLSFKIKT